jgi:subfamily B ATP-binding cassette protein MsbA
MGDRIALSSIRDLTIYKRLIGYLKPYWGKLIIAAIMMSVFAASQTFFAYLIKPLMDDIFIAKKTNLLQIVPFVVVVTILIRGLCDYGRYYLMADVGQRIIMDIRDQLYEHIQRLSVGFFVRTQTGVLISRITNDVNLVQASVTNAVTGLVRESFTMIGLIGFVFYQDWQLALIAMVVFPILIYPIYNFGQRLKRYSTKSMKVMGDVMSILDEAISGIRIVKTYNMEEYEKKRFNVENRRYYRNWMRRMAIRAISTPFMEIIAGFSVAFLLWFGGMRVINGIMTPGEFSAFIAALAMLYAPIRRLNNINIVIQEGIAAARRVFDLLDTKPEITDREDAVELEKAKGDIEYRDVSFSYDIDEGEYALKNISFRIEPGKKIAFVGESGAGKTSITNLLPRLFDVTSGMILVNNRDIREFTVRSLRANIAMVTQEMVLFNDTIKANIAYGTNGASTEKIIEAAKSANAHDFIMDIPDGYDTVIGEAGVRLSGGQRQRICIARAIIKDAPILILDEATSSLDTESEREVQLAMDKLMMGRTTLIIAHRISTIISADWIFVLNKGEIVEQGTHEELLKMNGYYTRLYTLQYSDA